MKSIDLRWTEDRWVDVNGTLHVLRGAFRKHITGKSEEKYGDYPVEALSFRKLD